MVDVAKGPAEAFTPLKAVLESISVLCEIYQVRLVICSRPGILQSHPQNTAAVKDKIEVLLLRIAALEKLFEQPASDEKETRRREGLSMYAMAPFGLNTILNPIPANLRVLPRNCGHWARGPCPYDTSITLETAKM